MKIHTHNSDKYGVISKNIPNYLRCEPTIIVQTRSNQKRRGVL